MIGIKYFPTKIEMLLDQIFKYILDKDITYKDFVEYNKLYCAVSGSILNPKSTPEFVFVKRKCDGKENMWRHYRCCIPCSCDLMKYSKTQKMKYKSH